MKPGTRILFFTTEDWYFCSHRLPVARAAREAGAEVHVVTRVSNHGEAIRSEGFTLHPLRAMRRRSSSPLREAATVAELTAIYHAVRPDLVHPVALKPVVYGSLAARLARVPAVVNALAGMGYLFTDDPEKQAAAWSRVAIRAVFRSVLRIPNAVVLFQNPDDRAVLTDAGVVALDRTAIIRGSGVDMAEFESTPEPQGVPLIVFGGRMLRQKGVGELHEAARLLRNRGVRCRVALVGDPDPENPASISEETLRDWAEAGAVEYWGRRSDMPAILRQAHIACLPSYREGLPKFLLEAASCGRPIVTTDTPGCREICIDGENGFLVPLFDPKSLADRLQTLVEDESLRRRMGAAGRALVEREFSAEGVAARTLELYDRLLERGRL